MTMFTESHTACTPRRSARFDLGRVLAVWRQRRQLKALDTAALSDIGLSRREADAEANRPVWDVPNNWLR